jgi:hypothetical protein
VSGVILGGCPALDLWRREIRTGFREQLAEQPGTWRLDALWRAAAWEAAAAEAEKEGQVEASLHWRREARRAIAEAVLRKQGRRDGRTTT